MFVLETSSPSELGTEDEAPVAIGDAVILLTSLDEAVILRASPAHHYCYMKRGLQQNEILAAGHRRARRTTQKGCSWRLPRC